MTAHADDEGDAEAGAIVRIEPLEALELCLAQTVETEAALLLARLSRHGAGAGYFAGELRMAADEGQLLSLVGLSHRTQQGAVQVGNGNERAPRAGALCHPGRMLEDAAERRHERVAICRIQLREFDASLPHPFGSASSPVHLAQLLSLGEPSLTSHRRLHNLRSEP